MPQFHPILPILLAAGLLSSAACSSEPASDADPMATPTPSVSSPAVTSASMIEAPIVSLNTGNSFGQCVGYCREEITLTPEQLTYTQAPLFEDPAYPTRTQTYALSPTTWEALLNTLDLAAFNQLPEVIGCPDCADGGAEWLTVSDGSTSRVVRFPYQDAPPELQSVMALLRDLQRDASDGQAPTLEGGT